MLPVLPTSRPQTWPQALRKHTRLSKESRNLRRKGKAELRGATANYHDFLPMQGITSIKETAYSQVKAALKQTTNRRWSVITLAPC